MAAMGKQLKQSVNVFHSLMLYLLLPVRMQTVTLLVFTFALRPPFKQLKHGGHLQALQPQGWGIGLI